MKKTDTNCEITLILQSKLLSLSVIDKRIWATLGTKFWKTLSSDSKQTKQIQCENLKLKLRNGTWKMSVPTLQEILAKYWFYLNVTYQIETFWHVWKIDFYRFILNIYITNLLLLYIILNCFAQLFIYLLFSIDFK